MGGDIDPLRIACRLGYLEAPARLGERRALAEAEGFPWTHLIHPGCARVCLPQGPRIVVEGAVPCGEAPVFAVLRQVGVRHATQRGLAASPSMTRSRPSPSRLHPVVRTQRGFCARFFALRSSGPVQKYNAPSSQAPRSGVTCGRPFGRTVEIQYTSAPSRRSRPSAHGAGVAPSLLNRGSRSVVGSLSIIPALLRLVSSGVASPTRPPRRSRRSASGRASP